MCVEILHSSDMSSSMDSFAYDSSSTTSPASVHPGSHPSAHSQQQRTKRMRTSFKHHQLRTMKSYFNVNQNPDAKDLKQLAQKTGLSKRVLQVGKDKAFFWIFSRIILLVNQSRYLPTRTIFSSYLRFTSHPSMMIWVTNLLWPKIELFSLFFFHVVLHIVEN